MSFRHHTNPVGTEWKWKKDDPSVIVNGAMENHYNMIKQFKGMNSKLSFISNVILGRDAINQQLG